MIAVLRAYLEILNRFIGRFWLTVLYFTVVLPFGIIARLRSATRPVAPVAWSTRKDRGCDLTEARKQF